MTLHTLGAAEIASGAFCPYGNLQISGAAEGPLARLRVGVKDLFDVAGYPTGAGNPDWLATHAVPTQHAAAVSMLLDAGADIVGKTLTDELAYSLNGENYHYGTPVNPVSPERIPGGSSCGSAVAVAAGFCDIGLGSDTAGSIRLPASFCGVWGFRPTHGVISSAGVVGLAPSYDAVSWITPNAALLASTGHVLLPAKHSASLPSRLLLAQDAWALANADVRRVLEEKLLQVKGYFGSVAQDVLADEGLLQWQQVFRTIQGREVWQTHGAWISACAPKFGPGIAERFQWASTISAEAAAEAAIQRWRIRAHLDAILSGATLCVPTVSFIAPLKRAPSGEQDRTNALCLLAIASLAGLPQITLPLAQVNGCAVGLSLIGARGMDHELLACGVALAACQ